MTVAVLPRDLSGLEPVPDDECDYCGFTRSEGAVLVAVGVFDGNDHATVLCTACSKDKVLGSCGHRRTCDCAYGYCS